MKLAFFHRDQPVEEVKPIRNKLCDLFGVKPPVPAKVS